MNNFLALFACVAMCAAAILSTTGQAQKSTANPKNEASFIPGEVLVQFKANTSDSDVARALG
ncbi:MAG TPA: hypothetical protein VNI84_15335, partial [Pyrinomonadaceae bacterium]|nr:hypothetical protein [Pyrinomonadaceae bacterium]